MIRGWLVACGSLVLASPVLAQQAPPGQSEFVPIDQLPPTEQLPGGVFVVVAYAVIWVAMIGYLWFIWQRLGKVKGEMEALERRRSHGSSAR